MKRFISFGEIPQFRKVVGDIIRNSRYLGRDENDEPILDMTASLPKVTAIASEKIHGTNAAVCYNANPNGFWVQSRKNVITPEKDNAACAFAAYNNKNHWIYLMILLANEYNINLYTHTIVVYFEWAGGAIQKNSACTGLDKRAIIFQHFKVSPIGKEMDELSTWYETKANNKWITYDVDNMYNIMNYKTWEIEIDFENPAIAQNKMIQIVNTIEEESLFGKSMGIDNNIGEGIVVTFKYRNTIQRFKVKGEKHSASKVKTLNPIDIELEDKKIEFANYACTSSRLEQAWQSVFGIENEKHEPTNKFTGDFIKAVVLDVIKEESDVMAEKGLEPKMVSKGIAQISKDWFFEQLDKEAFK